MSPIRPLLFALALVAICATSAPAQQTPLTHETLTVTSATAVSLSTSTIRTTGGVQVTSCTFTVENGPVRAWVDGTAPTTTTGHWISPGALAQMVGNATAKQFQVIAVGPTAAVQVTCSRGPDLSGALPALSVIYDPGIIGPPCNPLLKASGVCR